MSFALASITIFCGALIVAWFIGMLSPAFSRGRLATVSAILLLLPGFALVLEAPIHLVGIDGEEGYGFLFLAAPSFLIGIFGLTLALLARAKLRPFGIFEEE